MRHTFGHLLRGDKLWHIMGKWECVSWQTRSTSDGMTLQLFALPYLLKQAWWEVESNTVGQGHAELSDTPYDTETIRGNEGANTRPSAYNKYVWSFAQTTTPFAGRERTHGLPIAPPEGRLEECGAHRNGNTISHTTHPAFLCGQTTADTSMGINRVFKPSRETCGVSKGYVWKEPNTHRNKGHPHTHIIPHHRHTTPSKSASCYYR